MSHSQPDKGFTKKGQRWSTGRGVTLALYRLIERSTAAHVQLAALPGSKPHNRISVFYLKSKLIGHDKTMWKQAV